ncbi:MAG: hypothetical protein RIR18_2054 [Pseudomonadota bacterium]|jgi:hypothetical protein
MKISQKASKTKKNNEAQYLQKLGQSLANAGSQVEETWWKQQLSEHLILMLEQGQESEIIDALEASTEEAHTNVQDALASCVEDVAETVHFELQGKPHTALLIAIPILAWSRYALPGGNLATRLVSVLKTQFSAHVLAQSAKLTLANHLFSPDQLPRSFSETRQLLDTLVKAGLAETHLSVDPESLPESGRFLADIRYLLGAVIIQENEPVFRWQEPDGDPQLALDAWQTQGLSNLEPLFSGCAFEGLSANAYHTACRQADRAARPYAITASVSFLQAMTNLTPLEMQATIAPCFEQELVEYRVGIGPASSNAVFQGTIWPLMGESTESEQEALINDIEATLRSAGILNITVLSGHFQTEFCDDCGMPFYPNPLGELVHTEMPEGLDQANLTLH